MNIYVPDDLKAAMDRSNLNWSKIAQEAWRMAILADKPDLLKEYGPYVPPTRRERK